MKAAVPFFRFGTVRYKKAIDSRLKKGFQVILALIELGGKICA